MRLSIIISLPLILYGSNLIGQTISVQDSTREHLISISKEIMKLADNCALITLDETGQPRARTMDPFFPEDDMVVWFGTNANSRKVEQIRNDPRVTLYYFDKKGSSYVIIYGQAKLVDNRQLKQSKWKEEWKEFYPDYPKGYLLIQVIPETMELLSTRHNVFSDPETWQPPIVKF
ncbi:MAG: pyridoxamine 5'-phosphate oxidase family protein [Saprospiraceae bacterium]|nr:pyridoxamine 5'-phosphate oxidase family protein [Saprospiraceae bacterium]